MYEEGHVALVTGATGGGIGTAIAQELSRRGFAVCVNGRDTRSIDDVGRTLSEAGHNWIGGVADVSDADAVSKMIASAVSTFGVVDILICNASPSEPHKDISEMSPAEWQVEQSIILGGAFNCVRAVVPHMRRALWGRIIFISSSAASMGSYGRSASYASAKAGLHGLTKQLALELGSDGITVNCIAPGQIRTPRVMRNKRRTEKSLKRYGSSLPVRRVGDPTDISALVAFLCSPESGYITGQIITVDGGASLSRPNYTERK